jgi:hypothetical protein
MTEPDMLRTYSSKTENSLYVHAEHEQGQARKSARRMPWHQEPMKDVTSCDKLRLGANSL